MISATATFKPNTSFREALLSALERGVQLGAEIVAEEARALVPVDTGELRGSIEAKPAEVNGARVTSLVTADAPHAAYVEYGTGQAGAGSAGAGPGPYDPNWPGMVAQPYMRPAIDTRRGEVIEAIHAEVRGAL